MDSSYVWHSHYVLAIKGGLDPSIPADMAAGRRPAKMKDDERLIYDLLTQIYRDKKVTDAAFNAAVAKFGDKGVADIVAIASYYGVTSMSLIATNTSAAPTEEPPPAGARADISSLRRLQLIRQIREDTMKHLLKIGVIAAAIALP